MKALVVLLLLASPAAAEPPRCTVTIVRAPEEVRPILEHWVRAEPSCNVSLDVRVVPTDGGYYILATDENQRVRERIVPDAQSAGVLVASWIADDTMLAPSPTLPPPPADVPAPALIGTHGLFAPGEGRPPGLTTAATVTAKAMPAPAEPRRKWVSLAAALGMLDEEGWGMRGELDLKAWSKWALGVAAAWSSTNTVAGGYYENGSLDFFDARAVAYISHTDQLGKWQLREALGAGLVYTRAHIMTSSTDGWVIEDFDGVHPTADASLMFGRELGKSWAITAGVILSLVSQSYTLDMGLGGNQVVRRDVDLMATTAVRYRL